MKGGHIADLLPAYHAGTLTPEQFNRVKTHLIFCLACREADRALPPASEPPHPAPVSAPTTLSITKDTSERTSLSMPLIGFFSFLGVVAAGGFVKVVSNWASQPRSKAPAVSPVPLSTPVSTVPTMAPVVTTISTPKPVEPSKPIPRGAVPVDFEELSGLSMLLQEPVSKVFSQNVDWAEFWKRFKGDSTPVPAVNFESSDVVAIVSIPQIDAKSQVKIISVENTSWEGRPAMVIHYTIQDHSPAPRKQKNELYYPYIFKKVKKLSGAVFFRFHP